MDAMTSYDIDQSLPSFFLDLGAYSRTRCTITLTVVTPGLLLYVYTYVYSCTTSFSNEPPKRNEHLNELS